MSPQTFLPVDKIPEGIGSGNLILIVRGTAYMSTYYFIETVVSSSDRPKFRFFFTQKPNGSAVYYVFWEISR